MNETIDVLILTVYDMFEGGAYYLVVNEDNLTDLDQSGLAEAEGMLDISNMSIGFNQVLEDLDKSNKFPYEAYKLATNPKVLTLIID